MIVESPAPSLRAIQPDPSLPPATFNISRTKSEQQSNCDRPTPYPISSSLAIPGQHGPFLQTDLIRSNPATTRIPDALLPPTNKDRSILPPTLIHTRSEIVKLMNFMPQGFIKNIHKNGISPSGHLFMFLTKTHVAIMTKISLEWSGELLDTCVPGSVSRRHTRSRAVAVKAVALSDKYIFIGAGNYILVREIQNGNIVYRKDLEGDVIIDKLVISPNGKKLLALARRPLGVSVGVQVTQIYSANLEPHQFAHSFIPTETIWNNCGRMHSNATFSADGNKIAIYTSHCPQGKSEIRFLRMNGRKWIRCGNPLPLRVLSDDPEQHLGAKGVTGAAMYLPSSLTLLNYIVCTTNTLFGRWIPRCRTPILRAISPIQ